MVLLLNLQSIVSSSGNVSHTVILHPLSSGVYNISWASLSYVSNEEGQEKVKLLITIIVIMIIIMTGTIIKRREVELEAKTIIN